jgi:hypothetical protein
MWTYKQSSGELLRDGVHVGTGYSGAGDGKNNPDMQHVPRVGPTPRGLWKLSYVGDTKSHGPVVIRLTPHPDTQTYGRDGFLMHGDSKEHPGTASLGCIIQPRDVRELVVSRMLAGETTLEVVRS